MRYPVAKPDDWQKLGHLSLAARAKIALRSRRYRQRAGRWKGIALELAGGGGRPLESGDVVLLCAVRDGMKYLPSLLAHYRRLGVARFAFVDDNSEDDTAEFLAGQPDVDLFRSNVGFRQSDGGLVWRDLLVERYGRGRWYLSIDCDEYLVFPGSETRSLADFIADLERAGRKRALAGMIDIYPDGTLGSLEKAPSPEAFPTELCPLYDGAGYTLSHDKFCTALRGGPRMRMFGTDMRLTKFPLIFADRSTRFSGGSHHGPLPLHRNYGPASAVLLHFKFPQGAVEEFRKVAERGTHFGASQFYRSIVADETFGEDADFRFEGSRRYQNSEALLAQGFMQDLRV